MVTVFWLLANHEQAAGVQTAFAWDPTWSLLFGMWGYCVPGGATIPPVAPVDPGGPSIGSMSLGFLNCLSGPSLVLLAAMVFRTGEVGCLSQVNSAYPFGIHVIDCTMGIDQIDANQQPTRLGRVCVGTSGTDACDPLTVVAPVTWGLIKDTFGSH